MAKQSQGGRFRKRKNNFSIVSNNILRDETISLRAKGLYALIQSYLTLDDFVLYKSYLQSKCTEGERAFDSAWKELKEHGYLIQYKLKDETNRFYYEYDLLDFPHPHFVGVQNEGLQNEGLQNVGVYSNTISNNTVLSNTDRVCNTLPEQDYERLVSAYGKSLVDYQINKIRERNYKGCMNIPTIEKWCMEYQSRTDTKKTEPKKNSFHDFDQRTNYDYDLLEKTLLASQNKKSASAITTPPDAL